VAKSNDPFDLSSLPEEVTTLLSHRLRQLLEDGLSAKTVQDEEVDYWWQLYEQARTRTGGAAPWPGAADLTSHIGTEAVDSIHARLMAAVWSDPVCTVEGWGEAGDKAPFVEEFHQWKAEEERLQSVLDKLAVISLVEPRGLLEVAEGTEVRTSRREIQAKIQTDPNTGGPMFGEDAEPMLARDERGQLIEAGHDEVSATAVIDETKRVRTGPIYRILPYRDSLILPGHARDESEIFAYAKRFWKRIGDLRAQAEAGIYDPEAITRISANTEVETRAALARSNQVVLATPDNTAQIELWEILILLDIHDLCKMYGVTPPRDPALKGARWYLATIHPNTSQLLRFQHDHFERSRFVMVNLHPRADRVTEGYSLVGHKLITVIEEHTAWRNMAADRAAMAVQAPIKVVQGALWNPTEQPWGPSQTITVRDPREVEAMAVPDVNGAVMAHIEMQERTAQRLSGVNDIASGQVATENRTLGEIKMATAQSFVRIDLCVRRFQEAIEDLYQIRHAIWKRVLSEQPDGMPTPQSMTSGLEGAGVSIDQFLPQGKIMADTLAGAFRFKPHGSVETADIDRLRNNFVGALQGLAPLLQAFPMLIPKFQTPQAAYAMGRQFLRVFRVPNTQAFLGSPTQDALASQNPLMAMPGMGMMMPGMGMPSPPMGTMPPPPMPPPPMPPPPGAMMPPMAPGPV
jgi:hypothetical protein